MSSYINFHFIYLTAAIIVSVVLSIYAWRNPQTRGSKAFVAASLISIPWMLGDLLGRFGSTYNWQLAGEILRYFCVPLLPVALFIFIYQYCGKEITAKQIKLLLIIPLISWMMMLTNQWHYLFFSSIKSGEQNLLEIKYGLYFSFVHLTYSYTILFAGLFTLLIELSRASRHYRKHILLLLISISIPVIVNVLGTLEITGRYTPYSFPVFFTIMSYATFRHHFLGSNPIAYETVFQTIRDGVLILDRHDVIRDINPAAANGLGKKPSDVIGVHVRDVFKAWQSIVDLYDVNPLELGEIEVSLSGSTRYLSVESTSLGASSENSAGRIITVRDITDRHKHQLSLEALAFHDPLTRLANRRKFQEEVERAIEKADGNGKSLAILYFDLNRFKTINDTLGHEIGDEFLKYIAARVASILRKPDVLARLGGDEFALLLHNCDEDGVELVVERMLDNVQRPFRVGNKSLIADLSIGTAFYPKHGRSLTELLRHADIAMYQAKQTRGNLAWQTPIIDSNASPEM